MSVTPKTSYWRGHPSVLVENPFGYCSDELPDIWVFADTLRPTPGSGVAVNDIEMRPCAKCGLVFEGSNIGEPDPCLGVLPGVDNACCGHGVPEDAYIRFTSGVVVTGFQCIEYTECWKQDT